MCKKLTENPFPRTVRLTDSVQYRQVFSLNFRVTDKFWMILVHGREAEKELGARLGLAFAKKRISRAVDRNRLKRLVRESFRLRRNDLGNIDLVVMANTRCKDSNNEVLAESLDRMWIKIISQCKK